MTTTFSLEQNYFKLFNLPVAFDVDLRALKNNVRALQRQYHPDKFVNATPQEQRLAVQFSAHLNNAFSTLQNPVARAEHMLSLLGININHQNHTVRDVNFLMEQMTLREELEAAKHTSDQSLLEQLKTRIFESYTSSGQQFKERFESVTEDKFDAISEKAKQLAQDEEEWFLNHLGKMHFYEKLNQEIMR